MQHLYLERLYSKVKRLKTCDAVYYSLTVCITYRGRYNLWSKSFDVMFMINDRGIHVELSNSQFQRAVSIKQILSEKRNPTKIKTLTIRLGKFYSLFEFF